MNIYPGLTLCRTFRILHPIGEGAMGSVWSAHHLVLDIPCAIKILSKDTMQLEDARIRFLQEARTAARAEHPHVVRILDYRMTEEGHPFLVMELLRGQTLEERMQTSGPLSLDDMARVLEQASLALEASHRQGIIHRDIKAENVFLTTGSSVFIKLLDFGVAESVFSSDSSVNKELLLGTPCYMSPERLCQQAGDARVDAWALAVMTYYGLTGTFPFDGKTLGALCIAIARGEFLAIRALRPDLPPALDAWFARALAVDPEKRFASIKDLKESFCATADASRFAFSPSIIKRLRLSKAAYGGMEKYRCPLQTWRASAVAFAVAFVGIMALWGR